MKPQGFFAPGTFLKHKVLPTVPRCGACGLYKDCQSPKMPVAGKGKKQIMIIGQSPGKNEDERGVPFIGPAGQKLEAVLEDFDIDMFEDCWITNALICHPANNRKGDKDEIGHCRPNVFNSIKQLKPKVILLLGDDALRSVVGWLWKEDLGALGTWLGWNIPSQELNAWVCPTWHPAYFLHQSEKRDDTSEVAQMIWREHIGKAVQITEYPWRRLPDYNKLVYCILDPEEASDKIINLASSGDPLAFDYECDRLRPEHEQSQIVCASFSDGKMAIAYPWQGRAIEATKEILLDPSIPKIASNLKYEERWSIKKLGIRIENWMWDTMIAAHVIDNRPDITGIKFQVFVYLGFGLYNEHIEPHLSVKGAVNTPNRAKQIDRMRLLQYNGLDSLVEHKVAMIQRRELNYE